MTLKDFEQIWIIDGEYRTHIGDGVTPVALTAKELWTGKVVQIFFSADSLAQPTLSLSNDSLVVVFFAPAEASIFAALNLPTPKNVLDLWTECRRLSNKHLSNSEFNESCSLLSSCSRRGITVRDQEEKKQTVELILSKTIYSKLEKQKILAYNLDDVLDTEKLLLEMLRRNEIDLERSLIRGKFSWLTKQIEISGIPLDYESYIKMRDNWVAVEKKFISEIDKAYGVFEGGSFKHTLFQKYLAKQQIPWPKLASGKLRLDEETFKDMSATYPELASLTQLRKFLSSTRLFKIEVGTDGRNRTPLRPFASTTGRNQPSNSKNIMGCAAFLRSLIQPPKGKGIVSVDQSQQEFGIAAALSGDPLMLEAYRSGDPYLAFAKQAGAIPAYGTKTSHPKERELYKSTVLAVQYGMGADALAQKIGKPMVFAKTLLAKHRSTYSQFWKWSDDIVRFASIHGYLYTTLGWRIKVPYNFNQRSIRNFPMQANGAEILRVAVIIAMEEGLNIIATIHDAVMVEAAAAEIQEHGERMAEIFSEASSMLLGGFRLRSDTKVFIHPERYVDDRGKTMWELAQRLLSEVEHET